MLRVQDFMTTKVNTIAPGESCDVAAELMRRRRIRHLVVMSAGRAVGVVSARDLNGNGAAATVSQHMTPHAVTAEPRATVREVANKMRGRTIGCLPVLDGGKLVGIVTTSDLLQLLGHGFQRPQPKGERPILRRQLPGTRER